MEFAAHHCFQQTDKQDNFPTINRDKRTFGLIISSVSRLLQTFDRMDKEDRFTKGLSVSVVPESLRIRFTRELHDLREGTVSEVNFPPTLSTVERKFLHGLAQELGLTSKSKGKDEKRYITVTKGKKTGTNNEAIIHPFFDLAPRTKNELIPPLAAYTHVLSNLKKVKIKKSPKKSGDSTAKKAVRKRGNRFAPSESTAAHFQQRQAQRRSNKEYSEIQRKRQSLPSFNHTNDVVEMVRHHQISLISGETGCGKKRITPLKYSSCFENDF
jgi:hypothetical protein